MDDLKMKVISGIVFTLLLAGTFTFNQPRQIIRIPQENFPSLVGR